MDMDRIKELEEQIADLKARWPEHSVPPFLLVRLEEWRRSWRKQGRRRGRGMPRLIAVVGYEKCHILLCCIRAAELWLSASRTLQRESGNVYGQEIYGVMRSMVS